MEPHALTSRTETAAQEARGQLWPSPEYDAWVERLRAAVGETVYLLELRLTDTHLAYRLTDRPTELLDVLPYPRPDPARRLFPHMLLLSDGRGVNLGRVARVSTGSAFSPPARDLLYEERFLLRALTDERRLSRERLAQISHAELGRLLGVPDVDLLGE